MPSPAAHLTADEVRRLQLWAQGFLGTPAASERRAGASGVLRRVGSVQLDTISVLARSHELVPAARVGPLRRADVESDYWGGDAFEYWSHAACVLPIEDWPWFEHRRAQRRADYVKTRDVPRDADMELVLARLENEGPMTASDLGGSKGAGQWWDWTPAKTAAERLFSRGEVVCVERRGWRRVYDLPERAIPAELLAQTPGKDECYAALVNSGGRRLGVGTVADIAEYHRIRIDGTTESLRSGAAGLVPVTVQGWTSEAWADPAALEALSSGRVRGRHRTTLLSPFDSLIWDRPRVERVFGFSPRLEAYVPAPKRVHGYFAMALLAGGRLIGRVDPARTGKTLVAKRVSLTKRDATSLATGTAAMATALREAAAWVGCDSVVVEAADPPALATAVQQAVA